jgi:hypothetical protein
MRKSNHADVCYTVYDGRLRVWLTSSSAHIVSIHPKFLKICYNTHANQFYIDSDSCIPFCVQMLPSNTILRTNASFNVCVCVCVCARARVCENKTYSETTRFARKRQDIFVYVCMHVWCVVCTP